MNQHFLAHLRCPVSGEPLKIKNIQKEEKGGIIEATLSAETSGLEYPITGGIPRFVPDQNYSASFGIQWNRFPKVQLDSHNGTLISRERFFRETQWETNLKGQKILDVGCGMGRFTEIALSTGAECYAFDASHAVEAAYNNLSPCKNLCLVQASLYEMPFPKAYFDKIFCFGVLQHTPSAKKSFMSIVPFLKPGGSIAIDVYAAPYNWFHPRQIFRPLTKHMNSKKLYRLVKAAVPPLLKVSDAVTRIPKVGSVLRYGVPVANYRNLWGGALNDEQIREWAILDTYDWLSPRYERAQLACTVKRWFKQANFENIKIERHVGTFIARAKKI